MKLPFVSHLLSGFRAKPPWGTRHAIPGLSRQFSWLIITLSFILIFTGSALAANNDHRLPAVDRPWPIPYPISHISERSLPLGHPTPTDGAKVYKQWCSTCHGDRGQGLTEEWRATWPEGKQNCWQAKCHAGSHPPDGFSFPETVPAVIGPETLTKFGTAQDLYVYIRATMPYWSPNLLSDEEYLALTTFLVKANLAERNLASPIAWPADLAAVSLRPAEVVEPPNNQASQAGSSLSWLQLISFAGLPLLLLALGVWLWYRLVRVS